MMRPWLRAHWQRALDCGERLPHALLLLGPAGVGKREFAEQLAARLLCARPHADSGVACGQCEACRWRTAGNHPDLYHLVAETEAGADADDGGASKEATPATPGSGQIRIEQVRALHGALGLTAHHGGRRVVIVDPAEAMNSYTANALLKLLEEPPPGCVLLLLSSAPRQLLPTIRSRCQQWLFTRPDAAAVAAWAAQAPKGAAELLALAGGMPLAAERLAAAGGVQLLARFNSDLAALDAADAVALAGRWEKWLKSKEALAAGFGLPLLIEWMQRWVSDLASVRLGGRARFFPAQQARVQALASTASVAAAHSCYQELARIRQASRHPLNARLVLEDMLLRYVRAFGAVRAGGRG